MHVNRREFLRKSICAALGGVGLYSAMGNLRLIGAAAAASQRPSGFGDYKALVCIYLYGGNDSFNTIVPMSGQDQANYLLSRGDLALTTGLNALNPVSGGGPANYGLHPSMPELAVCYAWLLLPIAARAAGPTGPSAGTARSAPGSRR